MKAANAVGMWVGVGALVFAIGCAKKGKPAQSPALEDRQFDDQYASLGGIQNESDHRADRLRASGDVPDDRPPAAPPIAPAMTRDLRSIHLSDESEGDGPPADETDETPRPAIRLQGVPGRGIRGRGASVEGASYEDQDTSSDTSTPAPDRPAALDPNAKRAYEQAIGLVSKKAYNEALDKLASFLVKYPDHPYAENALYWRGECYFAQGEYARALEQFEGLIARFPGGNKLPDALLKLGLTEQKLGDADKAKAAFDRLERDYPRSEAARRVPSTAQGKP